MSDLILPKDKIVSLEDCVLCKEGGAVVGEVGKRGSLVYRGGQDPSIDWVTTLQKSNISDAERGFTLMIMPLGHLTAFSQVHSSRELSHRFGEAFARTNYAIQVVRSEEWKPELGVFTPAVVTYGKCASEINTQSHFHIKAYTLDGSVSQPSPSDTDWIKRDVFKEADGSPYVKAKPVIKGQLADDRYAHLVRRLTEICNNP